MHCRAISLRGSYFEVFEREVYFYSVPLLKHGDPVGDQRFVSFLLYLFVNKLCLSSTSNDVIFPLKSSRKFATTLAFLVAKK